MKRARGAIENLCRELRPYPPFHVDTLANSYETPLGCDCAQPARCRRLGYVRCFGPWSPRELWGCPLTLRPDGQDLSISDRSESPDHRGLVPEILPPLADVSSLARTLADHGA